MKKTEENAASAHQEAGQRLAGCGDGRETCREALPDVTERVLAKEKEALIQAKEEWERTFDSVPDLIAILDNEHRVVRVNRAMAMRLGRQPEECVGVACCTLIHGTDSPPAFCPHSRTLSDGREHEVEIHESHLGRDFLISTTPLQGPDGRMNGVVHVARDITERKRAEEKIERLNAELAARAAELEEANRELEAFNYTVAHDLRKPLTTISSYCQVILELYGDKLEDKCKGYLQEVNDGTWRMNRLIDTLLKFSHVTRMEPRWQTVDMGGMAREVAAGLKLAEPARRATFRITEGMSAVGDAGLLRMALENLLANAWKYTAIRDEAVIEFGVAEIDGRPAWFVKDNGPGFDMADAAGLFVPFQRLPGSEAYSGFGIGLATVERIVRRHGGRVWAEGEPGRGATFYFTLGISITS